MEWHSQSSYIKMIRLSKIELDQEGWNSWLLQKEILKRDEMLDRRRIIYPDTKMSIYKNIINQNKELIYA